MNHQLPEFTQTHVHRVGDAFQPFHPRSFPFPPAPNLSAQWCPTLCNIFFSLFFATFWTAASQAPPSMGFPRQEYWSGLPLPPPGDFPNPQIKSASPVSPALQMGSLPLSHQGSSSIK